MASSWVGIYHLRIQELVKALTASEKPYRMGRA